MRARHCRSPGSPLSSTPLLCHDAPAFNAGAFAFGLPTFMQYVLKFLTRLPLPVLYALGRFAYVVAYHVMRWHRELAARNLANAFPEKSEAERGGLAEAVVCQPWRDAGGNVLGLWRERRGVGPAGGDRKSEVIRSTSRQGSGGRADRARLQLGVAAAGNRRAVRHSDRRRLQAVARCQPRRIHSRYPQPLRR